MHVGKRRAERHTALVIDKYLDTNKPTEEWVDDPDVTSPDDGQAEKPSRSSKPSAAMRVSAPDSRLPSVAASVSTHHTQEDSATIVDDDAVHVRDRSIPRNIDKVNFGQWQIKTWYVVENLP